MSRWVPIPTEKRENPHRTPPVIIIFYDELGLLFFLHTSFKMFNHP